VIMSYSYYLYQNGKRLGKFTAYGLNQVKEMRKHHLAEGYTLGHMWQHKHKIGGD